MKRNKVMGWLRRLLLSMAGRTRKEPDALEVALAYKEQADRERMKELGLDYDRRGR